MVDTLGSVGPAAATPAPAATPAASRPSRPAADGGSAAFGPAATIGASGSETSAPVKAAPAPLRLSVGRADNGVFVYTLKDPQTGSVIAVIPRAELRDAQGAGSSVDRKV